MVPMPTLESPLSLHRSQSLPSFRNAGLSPSHSANYEPNYHVGAPCIREPRRKLTAAVSALRAVRDFTAMTPLSVAVATTLDVVQSMEVRPNRAGQHPLINSLCSQ
jgi:hypothetical protein